MSNYIMSTENSPYYEFLPQVAYMPSCRSTLSEVQLVLCIHNVNICTFPIFESQVLYGKKNNKNSLRRFLSLRDNERKCQVLGWYFSVLLSLVGIRVRIGS